MSQEFSTGTRVDITGAFTGSGMILGAGENALIVSVASNRSVTLRRDPASTSPEQWRYQGMPVTIAKQVSEPTPAPRQP